MEKVFELIKKERERQDKKWGVNKHDSFVWLAIITEELGEVAQAIFSSNGRAIRDELVQVAAVAVAWLEQFDHWDETNNKKELN